MRRENTIALVSLGLLLSSRRLLEPCFVFIQAAQSNFLVSYIRLDATLLTVLSGKLAHFVSKTALDIEGLAEKNLKQLVDAGIIRSLDDILELPKKRDRLLELDGWKERKIDNLLSGIQKVIETPLPYYRFLNALGIEVWKKDNIVTSSC